MERANEKKKIHGIMLTTVLYDLQKEKKTGTHFIEYECIVK